MRTPASVGAGVKSAAAGRSALLETSAAISCRVVHFMGRPLDVKI